MFGSEKEFHFFPVTLIFHTHVFQGYLQRVGTECFFRRVVPATRSKPFSFPKEVTNAMSRIYSPNTFKVIYLICSRVDLVAATFLTFVLTHAHAVGTPETRCVHLSPPPAIMPLIPHMHTANTVQMRSEYLPNKLRVPFKHAVSTFKIRWKHCQTYYGYSTKRCREPSETYWLSK